MNMATVNPPKADYLAYRALKEHKRLEGSVIGYDDWVGADKKQRQLEPHRFGCNVIRAANRVIDDLGQDEIDALSAEYRNPSPDFKEVLAAVANRSREHWRATAIIVLEMAQIVRDEA